MTIHRLLLWEQSSKTTRRLGRGQETCGVSAALPNILWYAGSCTCVAPTDMDINISATRTSYMANETGIVGLAGPRHVHVQVCTCTHVPCVHIQCAGTSVGDSCGCELSSPALQDTGFFG